MAYDSRVYRILIASPSDVDEEREIAVKTIQDWNDLHSYIRRITLLPLRWETHVAPEYGKRPQEVINREIVDECDLLIGIFWTRIGASTGSAVSGTLEEIERVGNANKPVMLYFSSVGADPAGLNLEQLGRLVEFRRKTYPNGLIESYKTRIEFREKLLSHLERKVRDLQQSEGSGHSPLTLSLLSPDTGEPVGGSYAVAVERPRVSDLGEVPEPERAKVSELVAGKVFEDTYVPMPLSISNDGSSSVRSLYIEFDICASDDQTEITAYPRDQSGVFNYDFFLSTGVDWVDRPRPGGKPSVRTRTEKNLAKYSAEKLQRVDKYWRLCVACDAVQPQRTRVIRPVLYVSAPKSSEISIQARVFADTSPGPFTLTAKLSIAVTEKEAKLQDVLPSWRDDLKKSVDANGVLGRLMEVASEDVQVLAAT
jgi:hypothetical protein